MAIYIQIDGIDGDATHEKHVKWIDAVSLQWGVGRAITTPVGSTLNREASEPSISEVTFTKLMDGASPYLLEEATTGTRGKNVKIHLVSTGSAADEYCEYKLENSLISGYSIVTDGDRPMESVTINFTKVEMKFTPYDPDHKPKPPVMVGYDMTTTKKV